MFALNTNVNCLYIQTYEYAKVRADKMTIYIYIYKCSMEYKRVCIHIIVKTIEFGVKNRTTDKNISIKNK